VDPSNAQYGAVVSWWKYVEQHKGDADQAQIAIWAGVAASTVSRWKTGKMTPGPETAVAFARARGIPVLGALVAAGFLSAEEAGERPAGLPDYSQLTNDELLELVRARMSEGGEHGGDTAATRADFGSVRELEVDHYNPRDPRNMQEMQTRAARSERNEPSDR
jgi:transcriptional regulator with XRE-family HTH domain